MTAADFAVQIKLIIMYTVGLLALIGVFLYLHHVTHRWLGRPNICLLAVILVMLIILVIVTKLP